MASSTINVHAPGCTGDFFYGTAYCPDCGTPNPITQQGLAAPGAFRIRCIECDRPFLNKLPDPAKLLSDWLSKVSGYTVHSEWQIDWRSCRFHFGDLNQKWTYILDVYNGDIRELTLTELTARLKTANWWQVLRAHSGKNVPLFKDRRFSPASKFREWPS